MKKLTHLDKKGNLAMVDVGEKGITSREAKAAVTVWMKAATLKEITRQGLAKGDVLAAARLAGILGAKQASSLIPLTHPLLIDHVEVAFHFDGEHSRLEIVSKVRCQGKTGVEIEALTACAIAALTVYDMCKSMDRDMVIDGLRLLHKSGGRSGTWNARGANKRGARSEEREAKKK